MSDTSILLLEDSLELGALTLDVLHLAGYGSVRHVVNNEDAIAALNDEGFDLCIFDLRLDGDTCEPAMHAAFSLAVPVILTSGSTLDMPDLAKTYTFVEKPAGGKVLTRAITNALKIC
ncbi:hypothetical protein N9C96_01985 [bacterium]|nr:hypothetical protein [bacterium]